jgi:tetratricopeptide (TPR) repeat protein
VNEPGPVASDDSRASRAVFISYATPDRKEALSVCKAIERRGVRCWIAMRDVGPGENYQEEIFRAIRDARAMVLVFSGAANTSDEIKKELSLASRHRVPVIALRIEDVEPSDAFAYELSTRQWIDAFAGWDKSLDAVAHKLGQVSGPAEPQAEATNVVSRRARLWRGPSRGIIAATAVLLFLIAGAGAWLLLRPIATPAHTLQVRLAGFQRLSSDLPATLPDAMREELIAAFGNDAIVSVSTAAAPPSGNAPAYALGGTIGRDGDKIKVIARLTNERTGTTLWANSFVYDAAKVARVPRSVAIDASGVTRCGLFGASTYPKALSEATLTDYFQYCHNAGIIEQEPAKALDFARKVVAATPDFSWGWSAVEVAALNAWVAVRAQGRGGELRQEALRAADRAFQLDRSNSEALTYKSTLVDPDDLIGREKLLQQAVRARTLPCGCEHHFYAEMLIEVGRTNDAIAEFRRSIDILSLNSSSQLELGGALLVIGRPDQAKEHIAAAVELDNDPASPGRIRATLAPLTRDYAGAIKTINDPEHGAPPPIRLALTAAFRALQTNNPQAKTAAIAGLEAMPIAAHGGLYTALLGALGANRQALDSVVAAAEIHRGDPRSSLFTPMMAGALRDPAFSRVAGRLGLMNYWKTTRTKPDVCSARGPPPFCRMI